MKVVIIAEFAVAHQNREKDCDRGSKGRGQEELVSWVNWKCLNVSENLFWKITFVNSLDIDVEYLVVWGKREDQRQPEGLQQCQPKYACPCTFGWSKGSNNGLGSIMSVLTQTFKSDRAKSILFIWYLASNILDYLQQTSVHQVMAMATQSRKGYSYLLGNDGWIWRIWRILLIMILVFRRSFFCFV